MKIALITDTHIGARNDAIVFSNYFLDFFEQDFLPYLDDNGIDTIIHLGDLFDRRKYANFRTLHEWRTRFFNRLRDSGIKMHVILGNHDIYYKNTNHINSVSELVEHYDNIIVYDKPEVHEFDDCGILFLPWINQENVTEALEAITKANTDIAMGHLEIKGFEMFRGHFNQDKGLDIATFKNFDLVLSGHFHHKSTNGSIHYLGSPYEMVWSDWGDNRGYHIFDTNTREVLFVENPRKIFHKFYYNDSKEPKEKILEVDFSQYKDQYIKVIVSHKSNPYLFDRFIELIEKANPADLSITELAYEEGDLEDESFEGKDTLTILREYIESLPLQNKSELIDLCREIYLEAAKMDV